MPTIFAKDGKSISVDAVALSEGTHGGVGLKVLQVLSGLSGTKLTTLIVKQVPSYILNKDIGALVVLTAEDGTSRTVTAFAVPTFALGYAGQAQPVEYSHY